MLSQTETQGTITKSIVDDYLLTWVEAFMIDRKARGLADGTLRFYQQKLKLFSDYCETQVLNQIGQITPTLLRQYLLWLEDTGHNEGGRHAAYRTLRAFLYWYEDEVEPEGWRNPIRKVKAPKVPTEPIDPVSLSVNRVETPAFQAGRFEP
jgi:site-specific recombinase XerD